MRLGVEKNWLQCCWWKEAYKEPGIRFGRTGTTSERALVGAWMVWVLQPFGESEEGHIGNTWSGSKSSQSYPLRVRYRRLDPSRVEVALVPDTPGKTHMEPGLAWTRLEGYLPLQPSVSRALC